MAIVATERFEALVKTFSNKPEIWHHALPNGHLSVITATNVNGRHSRVRDKPARTKEKRNTLEGFRRRRD